MSKLNSRYIHAIFCDDVRTEIGGKLSLMGLYQSSMQLSVPTLPVLIPKMCVVVEARSPSTDPFQKLHIRVLLDEQVLVEGGFTSDQLQAPNSGEEATYMTHGLVFAIQPFVIEGEGTLRVRAETEHGEIKVGGLKIEPVLAGGSTSVTS
jgi:hypothetical protein